ncbi:MAG: sel1 repeat family protein [Oscillospiraceae bacterium]|nr:sel1 repeat family protein [Oscillospiraceae bacterium]
MGLFGSVADMVGGVIGDVAGGVGEIGRIAWTAHREEANMTAELQNNLNNTIAAAENGNVSAMVALAEAYIEGKQLRYDPALACEWWTRAANAGHRDSMYNLGLLYHGSISKQYYDTEKAVFWLYQASIRGDTEAQSILEKNYYYSDFFKKWQRR